MNINWPLTLNLFYWALFNFALSGFLGGSETSFLSINRIILYSKGSKGSLSAKILVYLVERSALFMSSIVIANNATLVLGTLYITRMLMEGMNLDLFWTTILGTVITSPFQLIIGEVLPKALFHPFSNILAYQFAPIWIVIHFIVLPISLFFKGLLWFIARICNIPSKGEGGFAQSEFQDLLDVSLKSGALNAEERGFINNILEIHDIRASEAMVPLAHLDCLEESEPVSRALALIQEKKGTVFPVYRGRIDNPIGRLRAKDLLSAAPDDPVGKYVEEAFFIPETAPLEKVILQMQRRRFPLAFVADEYGGVVGVLRIENIVSEIVGEVIEEGEIEFTVEDDGSILADGLCDVDDLFEAIHLDPSGVESQTLGGFLMEQLNRMPQENDIISVKPWYFHILSLRGRSIKHVRISKSKPMEG